MRISIKTHTEPKIKAHKLRLGSIGKVTDDLYIIHTDENGDEFVQIWPNSIPAGLKAISRENLEQCNWDVVQLPKGTVLELGF